MTNNKKTIMTKLETRMNEFIEYFRKDSEFDHKFTTYKKYHTVSDYGAMYQVGDSERFDNLYAFYNSIRYLNGAAFNKTAVAYHNRLLAEYKREYLEDMAELEEIAENNWEIEGYASADDYREVLLNDIFYAYGGLSYCYDRSVLENKLLDTGSIIWKDYYLGTDLESCCY